MMGGHVIPKGIVIGPFNYVKSITIWKFRQMSLGEKGGKGGGGLDALQSFWLFKTNIRANDFCSNESFLILYDYWFDTITLRKKTNTKRIRQKNTKCQIFVCKSF